MKFSIFQLMGNPSSQLFGRTLALAIKNFWCDVTIRPSEALVLLPRRESEPNTFASLRELHAVSTKQGYVGGLRLMQVV